MKPIHNLLRQRLQRTEKPIIEHPPIDLLSAFSEKALSRIEHTSVLRHLAHCEDCRNIIFLAVPEVSVTANHATPAPSSRWISWPVLRWASVAACAVIVVAAVGLHPRHQTREIVSVPTVQQAAPQSDSLAQVAVAGESSARIPVAPEKLNPVTRMASTDAPARNVLPAVPGKAKDAPQGSGFRNSDFDARLPSENSIEKQASFGGLSKPSPRWVLTADGTLQRSVDNGITWQQVPVPRGRTFRAVAADGLNIWVGGPKGAFFHSPDAGRHWKQIKPTIGSDDLIADIIGIQFDDAQHGMLTTFGDGTWMTSDGGRSWQKQ